MKFKDFIFMKLEQWSRVVIMLLLVSQLLEYYHYYNMPLWSYWLFLGFLSIWVLLPSTMFLLNSKERDNN